MSYLSYNESKIQLKNTMRKGWKSFWLEKIVLGLICTIVAIGFCVPVLIYITGSDPSESLATIDFEFGDCSTSTTQVSGYHYDYC